MFNQIKYQNEYIKEKYDRINLTVPKGKKQLLVQAAKDRGMSLNQLVNYLIDNELRNQPTQDKSILEKWQVPKKYHDMIESASYSKEDGYRVTLKEGFINDVTGCRLIHVQKTKELRLTINKTRKCSPNE